MENHIYEVMRPLVHGGKSYSPGETVTMSEGQAKWLKAGGQIKRWRRPEPKKKKRKARKRTTKVAAVVPDNEKEKTPDETAGSIKEEVENG